MTDVRITQEVLEADALDSTDEMRVTQFVLEVDGPLGVWYGWGVRLDPP